MNNTEIKIIHGKEITSYLKELSKLRMTVFREWPYLYDGDMEYEKKYLSRYAMSASSRVILCFDDKKIVGASTCIALEEENDDLKLPLKKEGLDVKDFFYLGESILLNEYRGQGFYKSFFQLREQRARELGYKMSCFCAIDRDSAHPDRPINAVELAPVWRHFGYTPLENVKMSFTWKDINEEKESKKTLSVWFKDLDSSDELSV